MRVQEVIELNKDEGLQCRYEAMRDHARNTERIIDKIVETLRRNLTANNKISVITSVISRDGHGQ